MGYKPVTSHDRLRELSEQAAQELADVFEAAERDIVARLLDALAKGNNTDHLAHQAREIDHILRVLGRDTSTWLQKTLPDLYAEGQGMADAELRRYGVDAAQKPWNGPIHIEAVKVLSDAMHGRLDGSITTVGRQVNDIFQALALENIRGTAIGYASWQNVAKVYRESLSSKGITGFVAKNGTQWNLSTYAKMVARTTSREVALNAQANRLLEHGVDLVVVDEHYFGKDSPCDLCSPWQNRVLSLTGKTPGYPTWAEARAAGLFHPNCRHVFSMDIDLDDEIAKLLGQQPEEAPAVDQPSFPVDLDLDGLKTTAEIEAWAHQQFGPVVDLGSLKPDVARAVVRSMQQFESLFPGLMRTGLAYLGDYRGDKAAPFLITYKKNQFGRGVWAHYRMLNSKDRMVGLGAAFRNPKKFLEELASAASSGWHPKGCDTIESVVTHELGHFLSRWLQDNSYGQKSIITQWKDGVLSDHLKSLPGRTFDPETRRYNNPKAESILALSEYALKNDEERWAEAFASSLHTDPAKQHPLAREVAELIPDIQKIVQIRMEWLNK